MMRNALMGACLLLLQACHLMQGSKEREVVTVIEVKSEDCNVYIRKNFYQDDAAIETESDRVHANKMFSIEGFDKAGGDVE
jgi:hypothetical protein